jgi:hypothetical protein
MSSLMVVLHYYNDFIPKAGKAGHAQPPKTAHATP